MPLLRGPYTINFPLHHESSTSSFLLALYHQRTIESLLLFQGEDHTHSLKSHILLFPLNSAHSGFHAHHPITHHPITHSVDMNMSKLWEMVEDRGASHIAAHGVSKSQT